MEIYQEPVEGVESDNDQTEEDIKIFESKYDNEFIGLLNEIGIRLNDYNKQDKLKIKSWINLLTIPCDTNQTKKNRNLYAIKLINQMINGNLEIPFTKFANGIEDLKWISPIDVKAELTKKFYDEIDFKKIEIFGKQQQKIFLMNHPEIINNVKNRNYIENKIPVKTHESGNISNNEMKKFGFHNNDYSAGNKIVVARSNDNKLNNKLNYGEKMKLINIIRDLEQKVIERDEIIEFQSKQIEQIKNRIHELQNLQIEMDNNE